MALFPLQANFRGDFVVLLVPVDDGDDMSIVADKVAQHAVGLRVAEKGAPKCVYYNGRELPSSMTVAQSGIQPMDWIEVAYV
ncbi:toluene monooxygenase [Bradyrhizobium sp. 83012]|uniref:Toluene monooxygenase n=1 Tax=Bradyrhizobium aeschynomenes TaxID=2734909 RepID=A0ABX2CBP1_9BRAD|nr:toluene-4-monooxygenase system B family protein [Bradyrhizobium aeschynomenes]NPU10029.1 toluene monooxygenase [Bradyrhizobium aeschynomenes]NPU65543.1 toluene monooxygenase [Bradyrhizobium aeschynomenes]